MTTAPRLSLAQQETPDDSPSVDEGKALGPAEAPAQTQAPVKTTAKKEAAQSGVVGPEGATVYGSPDFDSAVLATLPPGQKIVTSRKLYQGLGGLGAFYKVKFADKKLGYVVDNEIIPQFRLGRTSTGRSKSNPEFKEVEDLRERARLRQEPIYLTRYLGIGVGSVDFTEKFSGQKLNASTATYDFRFTGPGVLFDGPPLDFHFSFSPKVPTYYEKFAQSPPSGFFVMAHTSLLLPISEWPTFLLYYGFGAMGVFTKFNVQVGFNYVDSREFRLGLVGQVGGAYRYKRWLARMDAKYFYETTQYLGYFLTVQHEY